MKRPESYRESDCCRNCKYAFGVRYLASPTRYFCNIDKSKVPQYGDDSTMPFLIWDRWADGRAVAPWGYCDNYKKKEN